MLFKAYVQSARAASKTLSLAEAHSQPHVRDVYSALARGFITKLTDAGLALKMWAAGEELPAHYDETLRFYTAPARPPSRMRPATRLRVRSSCACVVNTDGHPPTRRCPAVPQTSSHAGSNRLSREHQLRVINVQ